MSEFTAKIQAELDVSQVQAQLDALCKGKKIKIDIDTGKGKSGIDNVNSSLRNAQQSAQSLGDTIKHALGVGSAFAVAQKGVQLIEKAARNASEAIKDFDKNITNIRLATGQSYDSARELVSTYNQMGQTLGATTSEVADSAVTWLRQGKSVKEANTLIKDSMMLSKVGMIDSAKSATLLTSAMKGYGVSVEDASKIVDKLTSIDANAAVNSGALAEAMSQTAVTANNAGVSMDKLLGYLATVGEVTQKDMSSIGNSFKTIFTRMNDIKAGKLELIDEDGTKELLSDVELTLKNVGIDLRASMNEFNSSGDVLDNLAAKWNNLSSVQQAALTKAFAGTRQGENFRVLMQNYDNATKYMNIAAESAGTAEKKFAAYADSIEAKQKTMQAAFESLATNTFSTELMGSLTEAGTALIQFIDKTNLLKGALAGITVAGITSGLSALVTMVSDAAIQFNNFNSALQLLKSGNIGATEIQTLATATANLSTSQLQAVLASDALSTSQRMAILTAQGMSEAEATAALSSMGLATAEEGATVSTFSLSGAVQGLWATLAANPLILVAAGVAAAVMAFSAYNQSVENARVAAQNAAQAFDTQRDSVQGQIDKITELRTQLASGTLSEMEAYQAKQQLMSIQNELLGTYGDQAQGISLVNGELETQIDLINELVKSDANKFLNENAQAISKAEKEMSKQLGVQESWLGKGGWHLGELTGEGSEQFDTLSDILSKYGDSIDLEYNNGAYQMYFRGDATQATETLNNLMTDIRNAGEELEGFEPAEAIMTNAEAGLKEANEIIEKYGEIYEQAEKARLIANETLYAPEGSQAQGKTAAKWLSDYAKAVKEYNTAMTLGDDDSIAQAQQKYELLGNTIHNMLGDDSGFSQYAADVAEIEAQLDTATESAIEFNNALSGKETKTDRAASVRELTQELKDLEMTDVGFLDLAQFGEGSEKGYQAVKDLMDLGKQFGYSTDTESGITAFANMLSDAGVLIKQTSDDMDETATELTGTLDDIGNVLNGEEGGFGEAIDTYMANLEKLSEAREKWNNGEFTLEDMLDLQMSFQSLNGYDMSNFGDGLNNVMSAIIGDLNQTSAEFDNFKNSVLDTDQTVGNALKDLAGITKEDFMETWMTEASNEYSDAVNTIVDAAQKYGLVDGSEKSVERLVDDLIRMGIVEGELSNSTSEATGMMGIFEAAIASVGGETMPAGQALAQMRDNIIALYTGTAEAGEEIPKTVHDIVDEYQTGFSKVRDVLNSQSTGMSISADDYASEELKDYTSALEYHNGVLQYNADKVNAIAKAKAEETKQTIAANKAQEQSKYIENAKQIEQLRAQLETASDSERASIQDTISSLLAQNSEIVATCNQYDLMTSAINEATSAYQNWLNAQGAAQSGDMFDSALSAMEKINNTLNNSESGDYGRIGNQDYKAAVDFLVPDSVDHEDTEAVNSYMDSIKSYLTFDDKGNADGLNIGEFCQRSLDAGLMTFDEASGEYKIAGQKTMQDFADGLGLSLPLVQAMFGEMEEFGGHFDWADEMPLTFGDLAVKANEAAEALRNVEGNENLKIVLDVSDFENKEAAIQTLDNTIQQMNDLKATPGVDTSQIEQANTVIQYCVAQKQMLEAPAVMSVDTSQIQGEIGNALSLLQQFQEAKNTIEMQASVGADTSEAEATLSSLTSEIQGLSAEVTATLNIDTTSTETIASSLEGLTAEMIVKAGVDSSLVDAYTAPDKEATVKFNKDSSAPDGYQPSDKSATVRYGVDGSAPASYSPPNKTATVTYYIQTVGSAPSGGSSVNGTAHAYGTARASGDWGTAPGGKTLVGELGQEIVVDPHTGKWYTVGDNGAEFKDIPKGAIVFNHIQSKSLLENGYAVGRAASLARGTALVTGGIRIPSQRQEYESSHSYSQPSSSSSSSYSSGGGGGRSSGGGGGSSGGGGGGGSSSSSSKDPDWMDWIEVKIDRIERKISKLKKNADNIYKSWNSRNKNLSKEISEVTKEITVQEKAYKRYIDQANSVGLDAGLAKRVREGTIDISKYDSDSKTKKKIDLYKQWYDAALDCKDAIDDLNISLTELYEQQFDNIITKWENALQGLQHAAERTENIIDRRNAYASDYVSSSVARDASTQNIKDYRKLVNNAINQRTKRNKELNELEKKLQSGIDKGTIKKGSEGYYSLLQQIQDIENEIDGLNADIIDYSNSISEEYKNMFDSLANDYENKLSLAEHLSNEYSNFLELAQARGYKTSTLYYQKLRNIELNNAKRATQLAQDLQKQLNTAIRSGEIKRGSQAWYDMTQQINDAVEAEQKATLAAQEYANEIRQIKWDKFDYLQEKISDITEESNFLIDLMKNADMFNDSGVITNEGMATAGLHAMNYNIDMNQADRYAKEIIAINRQIAKDPSNTDLIERKEELIKAQRDSIKAAENEKEAIKSLVSDGIKQELSYIKDLISKYNDALQSQKDLYDYQKKIKDQTSEISSLQKQLSAYANDVSEETRAKLQKIRVELDEKQEELEETEYERMISDTKKMLDDFYNEYETALNERLDNIDLLLQQVIDASNNNSTSISTTISTVASEVGLKLSTELQNIWSKDKIDPVLSVYTHNYTSQLTTINSTIAGVSTAVNNLWQLADAEAKEKIAKAEAEKKAKEAAEKKAAEQAKTNKNNTKPDAKKATTTTTKKKVTTTTTKKKTATTTKKKVTTTTTKKKATLTNDIKKHVAAAIWNGNYGWGNDPYRKQRLNEVFGSNNGIQAIVNKGYNYISGISPKGYSYTDMRKKFKGYESGAKHVGKDQLAWTNENWDSGGSEVILRSSDRAVLTPLASDDRIYNAMASSRLWDAANNPSHYIAQNMPRLAAGADNHTETTVNYHLDNVTIELPNVHNYNEMLEEMQRDNKFEMMIQAMTLGRINGKPSSYKYHVNIRS